MYSHSAHRSIGSAQRAFNLLIWLNKPDKILKLLSNRWEHGFLRLHKLCTNFVRNGQAYRLPSNGSSMRKCAKSALFTILIENSAARSALAFGCEEWKQKNCKQKISKVELLWFFQHNQTQAEYQQDYSVEKWYFEQVIRFRSNRTKKRAAALPLQDNSIF